MRMTRRVIAGIMAAAVLAAPQSAQSAQSAEEIDAAIERLGDFDYAARMEASRLVRRAAPDLAVPILLRVARGHEDTYVQFRAAVLLVGFGDERAREFYATAHEIGNDRVRAAAYEYFEHAPDPAMLPMLLEALERETSEFVRPALVRALAAHDADPRARERLVRDVDRGEAYFRGAVIEALGDYDADYAVDALLVIARTDGPLRDDALLALGKIGDARALPVLREAQTSAAGTEQPIVSATACLLGVSCETQRGYVVESLRYAAGVADGASQELLRGAATALAALAMREDRDALTALFDIGTGAGGTAREPIALALGTVTLRNPTFVSGMLRERPDLEPSLRLLRDAFDMLDEDLAKEQFYVLMRRSYWGADAGSPEQRFAERAIQVLEF
jgi:HEAT repeat protein